MTAQTDSITTEDPKTNPRLGHRHNPNAWRDCGIPPFPVLDINNPASISWRTNDNPYDAMIDHMTRAKGMLTFVLFAFDEWDALAYKLCCAEEGKVPSVDLYRAEVRGLIEVLGAIGESLDLARNAAEVVSEKLNSPRSFSQLEENG